MEIDRTTAAVLGIIGGVLSSGGLASKFIAWLGKRTASKTTIDAALIDAELTVNERLLTRISELEKRDDVRAAEMRALRSTLDVAASERDALTKRELELLAQLTTITRELETTHADLSVVRAHVERVESENRKLRDQTGRVRRPQ